MTPLPLDELVRRFNACELPRTEWTHAAHLSVGLWHVCRYGPEPALVRLRIGIRRLNESNGVVNSPSSGYHETITSAYVQLLASFAARYADLPVGKRLEQLLAGAGRSSSVAEVLFACALGVHGSALGLGRARPRIVDPGRCLRAASCARAAITK